MPPFTWDSPQNDRMKEAGCGWESKLTCISIVTTKTSANPGGELQLGGSFRDVLIWGEDDGSSYNDRLLDVSCSQKGMWPLEASFFNPGHIPERD